MIWADRISLSDESMTLQAKPKQRKKMEKKPTYEQAIAAGIKETNWEGNWVCGESTTIYSYSGKATITMPNGSRWCATGTRATGDASWGRSGRIIFQRASSAPPKVCIQCGKAGIEDDFANEVCWVCFEDKQRPSSIPMGHPL